jgi:hypothetical protein
VTALSTGLRAVSASVVSAVPDRLVTGDAPKAAKSPKDTDRLKFSASDSQRR